MINNEKINVKLWNCIANHYNKECYTDCLKDACLFLIQMIQEKSDIDSLDGEKLINNVFSESNPKLLINKYQIESEKDEQRGFGFILRGIICAIRNPISHDINFKFTKSEADSILIFISNYILPKFEDSKEFSYVENWFDFIFIENDDDTKNFVDILLKNISKKEKFSLMMEIIEKVHLIKEGKYKYFICKLYEELTSKQKKEIIILLNKALIGFNDNHELRMFFNHFPELIWNDIDDLVKVRIENIVYSEIEKGAIVTLDTGFNNMKTINGTLGTWVNDWIDNFSCKERIISLFFKKMDSSSDEANYVQQYFFDNISRSDIIENKKFIHTCLKNGNIYYYNLLTEKINNSIFDDFDDEIKTEFKNDYDNFKEKEQEEIPF